MTIIRAHACDGTVGAASTAAGEGFDVLTGTAPKYAATGHAGTCLEWLGGAAASYQDNLSSGFVGLYLRTPSALSGGSAFFAAALSGTYQCAAVVNTDRTISLYKGLSSKIATSTSQLTLGSWMRVEANITATTQTMRLFLNPDASTPDETLTAATQGSAPNQYRYGTPWPANDYGPVDLDQITVCDAWPNMWSVTGSVVRGVISGGTEVGAHIRGAIHSGAEVAATVSQVAGGVPPTGGGGTMGAAAFPATFPRVLA